MKTEKEKMLAGELYDPLDPQLSIERRQRRDPVDSRRRFRGRQPLPGDSHADAATS
jgi:maltose O-acetyltransferase